MTSPKKILAIDDDRIVRVSVRKILETAGYGVVTASSGEEALEIVPCQTFDLILTDIRMPGISGLQTLSAIREMTAYFKRPAIPEIVLTAYNDKHVVEEAQKMGVREFLLKPFDVDVFLDKIKSHLE